MVKRFFNKVNFKVLIITVSLLLSCTYVLDKVIAAIIRPYLRSYYDSHFQTKNRSTVDVKQLVNWVLFLQTYYLVVYHLMVLVAVLLVIFRSRLKIYKRELLCAYIIIAASNIAYFAIGRFLIKH